MLSSLGDSNAQDLGDSNAQDFGGIPEGWLHRRTKRSPSCQTTFTEGFWLTRRQPLPLKKTDLHD